MIWASSHEIMNGVSPHMFYPNDATNRAMMAQILYNLSGSGSTEITTVFSDVSERDWYAKSVSWAYRNGIALSKGTEFGARDKLTREDMAYMLYTYAGSMGMRMSYFGNLEQYRDAGQISPWARNAVDWAVGTGLIEGVGGGCLDPQGSATRAQLATVMQRFCAMLISG